MNDKPSPFRDFRGSVDDLLNHVNKIDADEVERVIEGGDRMLAPDEAVDHLAEEFHVSKEKARELFMDILMEEGWIEIVGTDPKTGKPVYSCTEAGMEEFKRQQRSKNEGS